MHDCCAIPGNFHDDESLRLSQVNVGSYTVQSDSKIIVSSTLMDECRSAESVIVSVVYPKIVGVAWAGLL